MKISQTGPVGLSDLTPGRSHAPWQAAKTTLFAAGNATDVRKKVPQATFFQ
jgi:hypothetical protein